MKIVGGDVCMLELLTEDVQHQIESLFPLPGFETRIAQLGNYTYHLTQRCRIQYFFHIVYLFRFCRILTMNNHF